MFSAIYSRFSRNEQPNNNPEQPKIIRRPRVRRGARVRPRANNIDKCQLIATIGIVAAGIYGVMKNPTVDNKVRGPIIYTPKCHADWKEGLNITEVAKIGNEYLFNMNPQIERFRSGKEIPEFNSFEDYVKFVGRKGDNFQTILDGLHNDVCVELCKDNFIRIQYDRVSANKPSSSKDILVETKLNNPNQMYKEMYRSCVNTTCKWESEQYKAITENSAFMQTCSKFNGMLEGIKKVWERSAYCTKPNSLTNFYMKYLVDPIKKANIGF